MMRMELNEQSCEERDRIFEEDFGKDQLATTSSVEENEKREWNRVFFQKSGDYSFSTWNVTLFNMDHIVKTNSKRKKIDSSYQ